jgi:hypothetical protein
MTGTQVDSHRRTRQGGGAGGQLPPPKILESHGKKTKKIRADISENRLNSGNFITILHKNSGKRSTAPLESIIPVRLCRLESQYSATRLESNTKNDATPVNRPQMTRTRLVYFCRKWLESTPLQLIQGLESNTKNDSSQQPQVTRLGLDLLISSYNLFRINSSTKL